MTILPPLLVFLTTVNIMFYEGNSHQAPQPIRYRAGDLHVLTIKSERATTDPVIEFHRNWMQTKDTRKRRFF